MNNNRKTARKYTDNKEKIKVHKVFGKKEGKKNGRKSNVDYGVGFGNLFFVIIIDGGLRYDKK